MSMQARIRELDNRHANLETKITEELKHPSHDPLHVLTLKKQKLALKELLVSLKKQH